MHELRQSFQVTGEGVQSETWDAGWRLILIDSLEMLVSQLWRVGIDRIFINGSFVEEKDHPNDIDGYFECELRWFVSSELQRALNALDPYHIWTWDPSSRRSERGSIMRHLPMWHRYRAELYPHYGNLSGIRDQYGHELTFPSAFRLSRRQYRPKGIVQVYQ